MKKFNIVICFLLLQVCSFAQRHNCQIQLSIRVIDITGLPLENIILRLDQNVVKTNGDGLAIVQNLCPITHSLIVDDPTYYKVEKNIYSTKNTSITVKLIQRAIQLDQVEVVANAGTRNSQTKRTLSKESRAERAGSNLASTLDGMTGINILKNGNNIAKPILNGLHSNRLLLINNGVRHESQQWGLEHAPEIDPFASKDIIVVKNADAVRYGPEALAGVILLESAIDTSSLMNGALHVIGQSNGRSIATNLQLEGGHKKFAYQLGVTKLKSGNYKTADYYLGNTGSREFNYNAKLQYSLKKDVFEVGYSQFSTDLGIFIGAHIGSKDDILARIANGRPFETYAFSYAIEAPRQQVSHQTSHIKWKRNMAFGQIEASYSFQKNSRQEFDLRRVLSDDVPMADMELTTQNMEILYKNKQTSLGIAGSLQINNNVPGTGTTPIIPNFDNHTFGIFGAHKLAFDRSVLELGLRYDYKYFDVAGYRYNYQNPNPDGSIDQYLLTDQHHFNNLSGVLGYTLELSKEWNWKSNIGIAWRAPSANELYSDGVHHGSGTYEVGNSNLKSEKGLKWVNTVEYNSSNIRVTADIFAQRIVDFIYAQPNPDSLRQTIRGTFPLFQYTQTNALLYGIDLDVVAKLSTNLDYNIGYASVVARNTTLSTYLPLMPADRMQQGLRYQIGDSYLKLNHTYVARQNRYQENSDYVAPPPSYHLFGFIVSHTFQFNSKQKLNILGSVDNLFNRSYKDYMDRFRYYTDAPGQNISLKINYNF